MLIPIAAGAGSCLGMLAAPARVDRAWSNPQLLADVDWSQVANNLTSRAVKVKLELAAARRDHDRMVDRRRDALLRPGRRDPGICLTKRSLRLRAKKLLAAFEAHYEKLYGRLVPNASPQVITWRLVGRAPTVKAITSSGATTARKPRAASVR